MSFFNAGRVVALTAPPWLRTIAPSLRECTEGWAQEALTQKGNRNNNAEDKTSTTASQKIPMTEPGHHCN